MVRSLSQSLCEKNVEISRLLPEWPCRALRETGSSWYRSSWVFENNFWPVIFHLASKLRIFLSSFAWWTWQGSDTVSVLFSGSGYQWWYMSWILSMILLHHLHVCLFGKCVHIFWNFSWARNTRPNYFLQRLRFLLEVFLGFQCDVSCCRFPWAGWCPVVWIFFRNGGVYRCNLPTVLNFVRARVHTNQLLQIFQAGHMHIKSRTSLRVENVFLDGPTFASEASKYVSTFGCCWSVNFSTRSAKTCPSCFLIACSEGTTENFSDSAHFVTSQSRTNSLSLPASAFSTTASVDASSGLCRRLPSAACAWIVDKWPSTVDARAERCPSANLRGRLQQVLETIDRFRDSLSKNSRSRILATFKIVLFYLPKIMKKSVKLADVSAWTDEVARFCHLASVLLFGSFLKPFRTGCFLTRFTSVTWFASSSHFPFGSSGYLSIFQVFS